MDKPNSRSSHSIPVVRGGGLVFIGLILVTMPILCYYYQTPATEFIPLIISVLLLATISFLDDMYNLSSKLRLLIQAAATVVIAVSLWPGQLNFLIFSLSNPIIVLPFVVLATLWSINHFNFMDGIDGICALQAVFLAAYALLLVFRIHCCIRTYAWSWYLVYLGF